MNPLPSDLHVGDRVLVGQSKHERRVVAADDWSPIVTVVRVDGTLDGCRIVTRDWCRRIEGEAA